MKRKSTADKLAYLILKAHTVSVEANEHRSYYLSIREHLAEHKYPEDTVAACEAAGTLVIVQVYPMTPIGSFSFAAPDLESAVDEAFHAFKKWEQGKL